MVETRDGSASLPSGLTSVSVGPMFGRSMTFTFYTAFRARRNSEFVSFRVAHPKLTSEQFKREVCGKLGQKIRQKSSSQQAFAPVLLAGISV